MNEKTAVPAARPDSSFVVYIDESGCDGFNMSRGSSHWLVLSAAVFRSSTEPTEVRVVDRVNAELNRDTKQALHFIDLKHAQQVLYASRVAAIRMRGITVAIHKPSITERGSFQLKNHLYNFACRLPIERVSWLCAAHRRPGEGDGIAEMIFSHRRTMSYDGLRDYLGRLRTSGTEIDWSTIDPDRVRAAQHRRYRGLQIADCIASSFFQGLEHNRYGFTEGRYAVALRPIMWSQHRSFSGAGIKLFPREAQLALDLDGQHQWLLGTYGIRVL